MLAGIIVRMCSLLACMIWFYVFSRMCMCPVRFPCAIMLYIHVWTNGGMVISADTYVTLVTIFGDFVAFFVHFQLNTTTVEPPIVDSPE